MESKQLKKKTVSLMGLWKSSVGGFWVEIRCDGGITNVDVDFDRNKVLSLCRICHLGCFPRHLMIIQNNKHSLRGSIRMYINIFVL